MFGVTARHILHRCTDEGVALLTGEALSQKSDELKEAVQWIASTYSDNELERIRRKKVVTGKNGDPLSEIGTRGLIAWFYVIKYGNGDWSLLSDKPTRPSMQAPTPATLDA